MAAPFAGLGAGPIAWLGVTLASSVASGAIFASDLIGQTEILTGSGAGIPVLTLLATALSGLAGTIVQGGRMFYRGDIVPKSLIKAVVKEALEEERRNISRDAAIAKGD